MKLYYNNNPIISRAGLITKCSDIQDGEWWDWIKSTEPYYQRIGNDLYCFQGITKPLYKIQDNFWPNEARTFSRSVKIYETPL
jgi:hypothetical protein